MITRIKKYLSAFISLLFLAYVYSNSEIIFSSFSNFRPLDMAYILILQIIVQILNSSILYETTHKVSQSNFSRNESFRLTIVASFVNFITPIVGGASTKAIYLKKKHAVNYSSFASILYANYMVSFFISFVLGIVSLLILGSFNELSSPVFVFLFLFAMGIFSLTAMIILIRMNIFSGFVFKNKFANLFLTKTKVIARGWIKMSGDWKLLARISLYTILASLVTASNYMIIMKNIGIEAGIFVALLFTALSNFSLLVNITPGNLGIRELIYSMAFTITGVSSQQVVSFSLLERGALLLIMGLGWIIFSKRIVSKV